MKSSPSRGGPIVRLFHRIRGKTAYYFRRYGWKFGLVIFLYYLVRDTILYIILPMWVLKEVIG